MKKKLLLCCLISYFVQKGYAQYIPINEQNLEQIHVSTTGNDNNTSTSASPYRTLKKALSIASAKKRNNIGIKIIIGEGTYREGMSTDEWALQSFVQINQSTAAPLVIEGAGWSTSNPSNTGGVIISGSENYSKGWVKNTDGTWSKDWQYAFGVPPKSSAITFGVSDAFLRREWVHVSGKTYYQINPPNYSNTNGIVGNSTEGELGNPTNVNGGRLTDDEGAFWVEDARISNGIVENLGKITIKLPKNTPLDFDLNNQLVEITTKRNALQIALNTQSPSPTNLVIRNLTFQHFGGQTLIQRHNNILIEDCKFIKNKRSGFNLNTSLNVLIRRCTFSENGEVGSNMNGVSNTIIERCSFNSNSRQGEIVGYIGWSVCGIKFYTKQKDNKNITLLQCEALDNRSTGFWWDTGNHDCQMIECVALRNSTSGTFIEDNNSAENNYEDPGKELKGTTGIPNLANRHTVKAIRCIFAHNRPASGTEKYRTSKGRGLFFSENENTIIDGCLVYNNDIQISTYDNVRAENRNFIFRNSLVAAQNNQQRLYAVGSSWDSQETLTATNQDKIVIATFKGGWYGLYDGMSGTTNDNRYYYPSILAFPSRSQRWGTDKWVTQPLNTLPTLTIQNWRNAHLNNTQNTFSDKSVDSRSILETSTYNENLPLVSIIADSLKIYENSPTTKVFTIYRVDVNGYTKPLKVDYTVRANTGDAINGIDFEALSGTAIIQTGERSVSISVTPKNDNSSESIENISLLLNTNSDTYVVANPMATTNLIDTSITGFDSEIKSEKKIIISPNPITENKFLIILRNLERNENVHVSIIDMLGKTIYKTNLKHQNSETETIIEVRGGFITGGTYILKCQSDRGFVSEQKLFVR